MTITNPESVKTVLRNGGWDEDFQFVSIYEYTSVPTGETNYALFTEHCYNDIYQSPYVDDPVLLMENGQLTTEGEGFLNG
jgi:hypothetical protein